MLGSEYGEQDRKAVVLYEYETFKASEEELLLDTYIRYLQVINDLKKCGYSKDNCDVNDATKSKKKEVMITSDPLALLAEQTKKFYSKPINNNLRTSSATSSANKKQEYAKYDDKKEEKKVDEKKRDMSKVKCYNYLDTLRSVRRPKHSGIILKKKGSSNTSNVVLSSDSHSKLNKDVKSYASYDVNGLFVFDDVSIRKSQVIMMPFRKKPRDSLNVRSKSISNNSLPRTVFRWLPKVQPLAEPVAKWISKDKRQIDKISKTPNSSGPIFKWVPKVC
nr:hypothetical protein [Tanacetum cinerariifolium]